MTEEIELLDLDGGKWNCILETKPDKEKKRRQVTVCGLFGVGAGTTVGQSLSCCIQKS